MQSTKARCHIVKPALAILFSVVAQGLASDPIAPTKELRPFDTGDSGQFETWLKETGRNDPQGVFELSKGVLHISGIDRGYLATRKAFRDYHLSVEYKWGTRTDGGKYVRNSGVLLNGTGAHGTARGTWMSSIEVQLAQGCEGDLIVIRGNDENGATIPTTLTSNTRIAEDKRTRWEPNGRPTKYSGRQFWWNNHQVGFKELLDTRGKDDVASPLGEWTKVECICRGNRITVRINGKTVNEAYDVFPAAGKILFQNEGHEIFFRNLSIRPVARNDQ